MIGTCSEWLLAICFQIYILSFSVELRHAYCHAPKLKLIAFLEHEDSAISTDVFDCCVVPGKILTGVNMKEQNQMNETASTVISVNDDDVYMPRKLDLVTLKM